MRSGFIPMWSARRLSPKAPIAKHLNPQLFLVAFVTPRIEIRDTVAVTNRWIQIRRWFGGNQCANASAKPMHKPKRFEGLAAQSKSDEWRRELKSQILSGFTPRRYHVGFGLGHQSSDTDFSADVACPCRTCRRTTAFRCRWALHPRRRHWLRRRRKASSPASSNRNSDIWFPSNRWSGPGFRCPSRTSRNEIRKSAWRQSSLGGCQTQGDWLDAAGGLMPRKCSSNQSAKIGRSFSMPAQPCALPSRTTSFASTPNSSQRFTNCSA